MSESQFPKTKAIGLLLYVAILSAVVLMPFTSLPVMPSHYRPISLLIFIVCGLLCFLATPNSRIWKVEKESFWFLLYILSLLLTTYSVSILLIGDFDRFLSGIVVVFLSLMGYLCTKACLAYVGFNAVLKGIKLSIIICLIFGVIELLSIYGPLPSNVKESLNAIVSGKSVDRIQLMTSEASWAARALISFFPFLFFIPIFEKNPISNKFVTLLAAILFFMAFSLAGFIVLVLSIILYFLISACFMQKTYVFKSIKNGLYLLFALSVLGYGAYQFHGYFGGGDYYVVRLSKISEFSGIQSYLLNFDSVFIRIYYPVVAFNMFLERPFGVGVEGFGYFFPDVLGSLRFGFLRFDEVLANVVNLDADPKNMYLKILAEGGFISFLFYALFICTHLSYLKKIVSSDVDVALKRFVISNFAVALAVQVQGGSLVYVQHLFSLALNALIFSKLANVDWFVGCGWVSSTGNSACEKNAG